MPAKPRYRSVKNLCELPPVLDTGYVAFVLQICDEQARRLFKSGKIKAVRVGKMWRVTRENLIAFINCENERSLIHDKF